MFVLLTFSCLLVSRQKCVLFPHCPCLSCPLFLTFSSLGNCKTFHSFINTHITFSACSLTDRFGMRAFFKHWTALNHSLFQGQG
ncbi:hypothetical protein B0H14DRAFT_2953045 [Mycena olivaceomarginata]|nr:hypothetical protein B0H14DRAFT_2953045 [Mycena olivaceomarginata]